MKTRKSLLVVLMLAMSMVLAACGSKGGSTTGYTLPELGDRYALDENTPAWKLDTNKETTTLTWYVNADWWNTDFGNDVVTKKIKEDLNIDIKFITGDDTKLNTFFAGEDLPDIITVFDKNSPVAKKANTWAIPLDELATAYDPHFKKVASEDSFNWYALEDGKTYGYPNYSNTAADYESGMIPATTAFVVRDDVQKALPDLDFTTQAGFVKSMNAIKEKFPELVPFGFDPMSQSVGPMTNVLQDMLGIPLVDENNEFYQRDLDPEYQSWIATMNEVYRNGGITDDSFSDDGTTFEEKIKQGNYATLLINGTPQRSGQLEEFTANSEGKRYIAVDAMDHSKGNAKTLNQSGISGWMSTYVTTKNADPIKTIQLFTYLLSEEGQILTNFGIEGETFTKNAEGQYVLTPEFAEMRQKESDKFKKEYRLGEFIIFGHDKYKAMSPDGFPSSIRQMQEWGEGKLYPHFVLENIQPEAGSAEARNLTAIQTQWNTTLVSMIRSKDEAELNGHMDAYKAFLESNNFAGIQEIYTKNIKANIERLEK
ncbi:sugar ABC transporter substrate-binding protein [Erysipelothrix anatis]|uniref:sugar ABC transporter substrate-binding protein n=1 Tax=Erysipelothrix anatis TaxID=2683713 RepID=UPI001409E85A|nr:sugar ABC transporter substrate-binding protein [Erysipelothrix anatis]